MSRIALALALALVGLAAHDAAAVTRARVCSRTYEDLGRSDRQSCGAITIFARCLAGVSTTDADLADAIIALETAEKENWAKDCRIGFQPQISVVERKMRIVSDEDVEFQRFRRETVGVFQLKTGQDEHGATLTKQEATLTKAVGDISAMQPKISDLRSEFDKVKKALVADLAEVRKDMNTSIRIAEIKQEAAQKKAQTSSDPLLQSKAYWLAMSKSVMATNEAAEAMAVVGIGFDAYYNPLFPPFFKCIYKVKGDDKATVTTTGKVAKGDDKDYKTFSLACHSPAYVSKKTTYSLTVTYEDGLGARTIPFQGVKGMESILFDMVWTAASFVGTDVVVDVKGLSPSTAHQCVYTDEANAKVKKITDAKFLPDNKYKLNCGKQPTGFTIKLTTSRVRLAIFVKGTSTQASYAGSGSTLLQLPTCKNGVKDGAESDTDCGGLCAKCGPQKACKKDGDCFNNKCNAKSKKCGGGPGTSSNEPGETCKQIKRDYPNAKNGRYYIRGVNNVLSPFKVYCWLADRDGGGWTLALVNWYQSGVTSQAEIGNADGNVLGRRTYRYKLHDNKIRAVIGQKSNTASMFEVMQDANGYMQSYTSSNREYNIFKDYTAKWHWTWHRAIEESSTKSDFHSYATRNFDGVNPVGDGTLNWRGRPRCGKSSNHGHNWQHNAGFFCHGDTYGSAAGFQNRPWGGHGCKQNLSNGRWSGHVHFFMSHHNTDTYVFICNGAQHTSGSGMSHRWWFRSGKDMEK